MIRHFAAALILLPVTQQARANPLYQGKPLDYWIGELKAGKPAALHAVTHIKPPPIDQLMAILQSTTSRIGQSRAGQALAQIGRPTRAVLPELTGLLNDKDRPTRFWAAYILAHIAPSSGKPVDNLVASLRGGTDTLKGHAAAALGEMGWKATRAARDLTKGLKSGSGWVRYNCAFALGSIRPTRIDEVPILIDALETGESHYVHKACVALEHIGPAAEVAIPALTKALGDKRECCRYWAAHALMAVKPRSPEALPVCAAGLKAVSKQGRLWAADILKKYGPDGRAAMSALVAAYREEKIGSIKSRIADAIRAVDPYTAQRLGIN